MQSLNVPWLSVYLGTAQKQTLFRERNVRQPSEIFGIHVKHRLAFFVKNGVTWTISV